MIVVLEFFYNAGGVKSALLGISSMGLISILTVTSLEHEGIGLVVQTLKEKVSEPFMFNVGE